MSAWRLLGLAVAGALGALPATAGPWPREKGRVFATLSTEVDAGGGTWTGLWAEYGLTPRITLGLDGGVSGEGDGKLVLWGQRSWTLGEHRLAASLGVGASRIGDETVPLGQAGLGWGRGITTPLGPGWLALEGRAILTGETATAATQTGTVSYLVPATSGKAELTLGLRPTERLMVINQLQYETRDEGSRTRLANSVVYGFRGPAKVEVGLTNPVSGAGEAAVKLGLWLEF